ncbi:hypothetical protein CBS101457_006177 [Exobasidium rhododendri]|nr:hypothetical protein CBS101457_006177 [Exobasidium rhododendri]
MAVSSLPTKTGQKAGRKIGAKATKAASSSSAHSSFANALASIENSLSSSSDLNPLFDLIQLLKGQKSTSDTGADTSIRLRGLKFLVRSLQALLNDQRIPLTQVNEQGLVQGTFREEDGRTAADKAVANWLRQRWNESVELLCSLLHSEEADIRLLALSSLMALQRDASSQLCIQLSASASERSPQWSNTPWTLLMTTLIAGSSNEEKSVPHDVTSAFTEDYLEQFDDVRFAFCKEISAIIRSPPTHLRANQNLRANAITLLWGLTAIPTKEEDLNNYLLSELKAGGSKASKKQETKKAAGRAKVEKEENEEEEEEMEDWFSDSDEEAGSKKRQQSGSAGLGKAAQSAITASQIKRQRKRNPPFREAVYSLNAQKAIFSRAWLAVLLPAKKVDEKGQTAVVGGSLSLSMMHEALVRMHSQILPHLVKPKLLHDFLVDCLDAGGATSLLALNALFSLMTTHNLNYASFYSKLYALLLSDPPFLHVRYRSRFLRLLDVFLSSTHLPATLVASFAKRLSRVALRAPPAAIVVVIPFVWNLCKRHKRCLGLLHRDVGGDRFDLGPAGVQDSFNDAETDPLKTGAIDSSLWELAAMEASLSAVQQSSMSAPEKGGEAHYLGSVSSLSKILAEPFTKERYDLEDFLDITYATLFDTETAKTLKRREGKKIIEPALVYALPSRGGKRLSILGSRSTGAGGDDDEVASKRRKMTAVQESEDAEEEDVETRNAKIAMREVEEENAVNYNDACARLFAF